MDHAGPQYRNCPQPRPGWGRLRVGQVHQFGRRRSWFVRGALG